MYRTRHAFYSLTKDDILDRLNLDGSADDTGAVVMSYADWHGPVEIQLTDQSYTEHGFAIPDNGASISMGCHARVCGSSAGVDQAYFALDQQVGQFRLLPDQLRVAQVQATRVRLVIDQQIDEILSQNNT